MILPLVTRPNPVLKQVAKTVDPVDIPGLEPLIADMFDTLKAHGGVGLAAPQVGHSISLFVVHVDGSDHVFINPVVLNAGDDMDEMPEGCLSLPGLTLKIKRSKQIKVMFRDRSGNQQITDMGEGWSRIFLHEFDHLQGVMIDDRVGRVSLDLAKRKAAKQLKRQQRIAA
jgi:peptide deformylase